MKNTALTVDIKITEVEEFKNFVIKTHELIEQIIISEFIDENGHNLKNNIWYLDTVEALDKLIGGN